MIDARDMARRVVLNAARYSGAARLAEHSIDYSIECDAAITMHSYAGLLGQVVGTLIHNVLQHAFADGRPGMLLVQCRLQAGDQVRIRFIDDGVGIERDAIGHVFEPFFTTRRGVGCTGLGLHIAFNIVTGRLAGTIEGIKPVAMTGTTNGPDIGRIDPGPGGPLDIAGTLLQDADTITRLPGDHGGDIDVVQLDAGGARCPGGAAEGERFGTPSRARDHEFARE